MVASRVLWLVDLRVSKKFRLHKSHNIDVSGDIFKRANMFNKKWGANKVAGKPGLYGTGIPASNAPGQPNFDIANSRYNYREHSWYSESISDPFQVQLGCDIIFNRPESSYKWVFHLLKSPFTFL